MTYFQQTNKKPKFSPTIRPPGTFKSPAAVRLGGAGAPTFPIFGVDSTIASPGLLKSLYAGNGLSV